MADILIQVQLIHSTVHASSNTVITCEYPVVKKSSIDLVLGCNMLVSSEAEHGGSV